jgi:hypothetical protein
MKNSDELVDRLLAAVRDAEAPEGMKQRIAARLQNQSAVTSPTWREWRRRVPSWVWGACMAGAIVIGMVTLRLNHSKGEGGGATVGKSLVAASVEAGRVETHAIAVDGPHEAVVRVKVENKPKGPVGAEDSLAMSEMMAPSQPAPELPLTEQERLFLQVVRRGDPEELAMLEPEKRAARNEEEKEQVKRFFEAADTVAASTGDAE